MPKSDDLTGEKPVLLVLFDKNDWETAGILY
jgi:hypothetical protein